MVIDVALRKVNDLVLGHLARQKWADSHANFDALTISRSRIHLAPIAKWHHSILGRRLRLLLIIIDRDGRLWVVLLLLIHHLLLLRVLKALTIVCSSILAI